MATINGTSAGETLTGTSADDVIRGLGGFDTMYGLEGNDVLDSRGGAGLQYGGIGNDTYYIDGNGIDFSPVEYAGEGYDVIFSTSRTNIRLDAAPGAAGIESLSTMDWNSTYNVNLYGNALDNYLIGNAGANILDGAAGNDALHGRLGNDSYFVDSLGDQAVENAGEGYDTVYAYVSYALNDVYEVEALVSAQFTGTAPISLTGNNLANEIIGNDGANQLDGGAGADAMHGRGGDDIYYVENAGDWADELANKGYDTVFTKVSHTLREGSEVEGLSTFTWQATTAIDLTGNSGLNYLIGNDGVNVLNGGAGSDTLFGKGGTDTFLFKDSLGANNIDRIGDFSSVDDTIQLDHNVFAGLGLGGLGASAFVVGTQAGDADDRIIYNQGTGQLYFDADGAGGNAAVRFATLLGNPVLTASDFVVI